MQSLRTALQLTCTGFAIYYSIIQGERYFSNEDTSVISFRKFNERPQDNYPDLTFCFEGGHFKTILVQVRRRPCSRSILVQVNAGPGQS